MHLNPSIRSGGTAADQIGAEENPEFV